MKNDNFTVTFLVDQSPEAAFAAITDVRAWWTGEIEGKSGALGDTFTYRYEDLHRTTQTVTEWVPGKKVVWRVTDSHLAFVKDKAEWDGTDIVFELARRGDKTEVRFTHVGLLPTIECHDKCARAWTYYLHESLQKLITTGQGASKQKDPPGTGSSTVRSAAR